VHSLRGATAVADLRNTGLLAAIDLQPRAGAAGARGNECQWACLEAGVLIRISGDTLVLSPPLVIDEDQIARVSRPSARRCGASTRHVAGDGYRADLAQGGRPRTALR
jgi:adenosylmethionine-8-amino-7-oxononanoate aminotransferase